MARLNDPIGLSARPSGVALGELAIAAGLVGESIALNYRGFPAVIQCELWKYLAKGVRPGHVLCVRDRKDLKVLEETLEDLRVVIIQNTRLCGDTSWAIQMTDSSQQRPAVFFSSASYEAEDDPGTVLSLVCTEREIALLIEWLARTSRDGCGRELPTATSVQFDPRIAALIARASAPRGSRCTGLRESRILRALLAGTCILRSSQPQQQAPAAAVVDLHDYELVRNLLCSLVTETRLAAHEPLAVDMINRANVYLSARYGHGQSRMTDSEMEKRNYLERYAGNPARRELITRRELADLGNVRSATVVALIAQLQRSDQGRDSFLRMGLIDSRVSDRAWRGSSARELARRLCPWSVKQVRGHFDRLRQQGLITAERPTTNGPWRYELPEALSDTSSPFSDLPTVQELATGNSAA